MWKEVAEVVLDGRRFDKVDAIDLKGWESVLLAALSLLPEASACLDLWWHSVFGYKTATSLLHIAARVGSERVVEWVLERGGGDVDLDVRATGGSTPLSVACAAGHLELVRMLVERRADVDVEGEYEFGPLYHACAGGNVDILRVIVDAGAGSGVGKEGVVWMGGMVAAAEEGCVDVVRELMGMGVWAGGVSEDGDTALISAARSGCVEVVRLLVEEEGVDVNAVGEDGMTPLSTARMMGEKDIVRMLLDAGARYRPPPKSPPRPYHPESQTIL